METVNDDYLGADDVLSRVRLSNVLSRATPKGARQVLLMLLPVEPLTVLKRSNLIISH